MASPPRFRIITRHGYDLPDGVVVKSATFGNTAVDVWQEPEPSPIWRGKPRRIVARWPIRMWIYRVRDEMAGIAMSEASAKAKGEVRAWESRANRSHTDHAAPKFFFQVPAPQVARETAEFQGILDWIRQSFPDRNPTDSQNDDPNPDSTLGIRISGDNS
jgi:hypothetical protein